MLYGHNMNLTTKRYGKRTKQIVWTLYLEGGPDGRIDWKHGRKLFKHPFASCLFGTKLVYEGNPQRCRAKWVKIQSIGNGGMRGEGETSLRVGRDPRARMYSAGRKWR
jgi:hypothetical protein